MSKFNTILLPSITDKLFFKIKMFPNFHDGKPQYDFKKDIFALTFLTETLIAQGAVELALTKSSSLSKAVHELPLGFKNRIKLIDTNTISSQVRTFLVPMGKEFGVSVDEWLSAEEDSFKNIFNYMYINSSSYEEKAIYKSLYCVSESLYALLIGMEYKVCIDINIAETKTAISHLRNVSANKEARAYLAQLSGLLHSYSGKQVNSIGIKTEPTVSENVKYFRYFIEDEAYKQLSMETHKLGFLKTQVDKTLLNIKRYVNDILSNPIVKPVAKLTTQVISTSSGLPLFDGDDVIEALSKRSYLPPIVDIREDLLSARRSWNKYNMDYFDYRAFYFDFFNEGEGPDDHYESDETTIPTEMCFSKCPFGISIYNDGEAIHSENGSIKFSLHLNKIDYESSEIIDMGTHEFEIQSDSPKDLQKTAFQKTVQQDMQKFTFDITAIESTSEDICIILSINKTDTVDEEKAAIDVFYALLLRLVASFCKEHSSIPIKNCCISVKYPEYVKVVGTICCKESLSNFQNTLNNI